MMVDCLVDGILSDALPVDDRGLRYGDGLFETIGFFGGRMPLWAFHMTRLCRDAQRLGLPPPDPAVLEDDCRRLLQNHSGGCMRITWTRGSGGKAYFPPTRPVPRRIVQRLPLPADMEIQQREGIAVAIADVRLAAQPALAGIKHLNRLEQILAARQCAAAGLDEMIMLDAEGRVVEALTGNLLLVIAGRLVTPEMHDAGVAGVALAWLKTAAPQIEQCRLKPEALDRADEIMVINSVRGIRPVVRCEERRLEPGKHCRRLQALWSELISY